MVAGSPTTPNAVAKITDYADVPLEFYHYPGEHWIHLRTANPDQPTRLGLVSPSFIRRK